MVSILLNNLHHAILCDTLKGMVNKVGKIGFKNESPSISNVIQTLKQW